MKGAFLLLLVPLHLKDSEGLSHSKLLQEVPYEVINNHISFNELWFGFLFEGFHGLNHLALALHSLGSLGLEHFEVVEVLIVAVLGRLVVLLVLDLLVDEVVFLLIFSYLHLF